MLENGIEARWVCSHCGKLGEPTPMITGVPGAYGWSSATEPPTWGARPPVFEAAASPEDVVWAGTPLTESETLEEAAEAEGEQRGDFPEDAGTEPVTGPVDLDLVDLDDLTSVAVAGAGGAVEAPPPDPLPAAEASPAADASEAEPGPEPQPAAASGAPAAASGLQLGAIALVAVGGLLVCGGLIALRRRGRARA